MLGYRDAAHAESDPDAARPVVAALACSLVRQQQPVHVRDGSLAADLYAGAQSSVESFHCSYGLVEKYVDELARHGLRVSGVDDDGQARIVELDGHRFFLATLFLPQLRERHPIVEGFLAAAGAGGD